jgi:hypothetical protein
VTDMELASKGIQCISNGRQARLRVRHGGGFNDDGRVGTGDIEAGSRARDHGCWIFPSEASRQHGDRVARKRQQSCALFPGQLHLVMSICSGASSKSLPRILKMLALAGVGGRRSIEAW